MPMPHSRESSDVSEAAAGTPVSRDEAAFPPRATGEEGPQSVPKPASTAVQETLQVSGAPTAAELHSALSALLERSAVIVQDALASQQELLAKSSLLAQKALEAQKELLEQGTLLAKRALAVQQDRDTPSVAASEVPAEAPAEVPAEAPAEVPAEAPAEVPVEAPAEVPAEAPAEVPVEAPAEVPAEAPAEVPVEAPAEVPAEAPAEVPVEAPAEVPVEAPAEVPAEAPAEVPAEAPAEVPAEAPAEVPAEALEVLVEAAVTQTIDVEREGWLRKLFPQRWADFLQFHDMAADFRDIETRLRNKGECSPARGDIFNAFWSCDPTEVRVVFVGFAPAPQPGMANGLAFSAPATVDTNRATGFMMHGLVEDLRSGVETMPDHAMLLSWARQGVLLLNTYLTVKSGGGSSTHKGVWTKCVTTANGEKADFVRFVLERLAEKNPHVVFIAVGSEAAEACSGVGALPTVHTRDWTLLGLDSESAAYIVERKTVEVLKALANDPKNVYIPKAVVKCLPKELQRTLEESALRKDRQLYKKTSEDTKQALKTECAAFLERRARIIARVGRQKLEDEKLRRNTAVVPTHWLRALANEPRGAYLQKAVVSCFPKHLQEVLRSAGLDIGKVVPKGTDDSIVDMIRSECSHLLETQKDILKNIVRSDLKCGQRHLLLIGGHPVNGWSVPWCFTEANFFLSSRQRQEADAAAPADAHGAAHETSALVPVETNAAHDAPPHAQEVAKPAVRPPIDWTVRPPSITDAEAQWEQLIQERRSRYDLRNATH